MAGVLERNIQIEYARDFQRRAAGNTDRLATLVQDMLPTLPDQATHQFAGAVSIITAGLWPYALPTDVIAAVSAEMGVSDSLASFRNNFREGLTVQLIGLTVQASIQTTAYIFSRISAYSKPLAGAAGADALRAGSDPRFSAPSRFSQGLAVLGPAPVRAHGPAEQDHVRQNT